MLFVGLIAEFAAEIVVYLATGMGAAELMGVRMVAGRLMADGGHAEVAGSSLLVGHLMGFQVLGAEEIVVEAVAADLAVV